MPTKFLPIPQILTLLSEGPQRIVEYTSGLMDSQLHAAPAPGEWSIHEILAHLRSCSEVWGNSILTILHEDHPNIRAMNPRTWIEKTDLRQQKFQPALRRFTSQRAELMTVLKDLAPKDWLRSATVTGAGKPLELTVLSYADRLAAHERSHVKQIKRLAGL